MSQVGSSATMSEAKFAAEVDALVSRADAPGLAELLREDHPVYDQRGAAAVVRMRGWVMLGLGRIGLSDAGLLFVLEELDTGRDSYLVAAAARVLRSYPQPQPGFAPFLTRALNNIRFHDEPVAFDEYGQYATGATQITPIRELLASFAWLGPLASGVLPQLEALRNGPGSFPRRTLAELDRVIGTIAGGDRATAESLPSCCAWPGFGNGFFWRRETRRGCAPVEAAVFEDHDGRRIRFAEFFRGHPSIVVFFYTRCDNPQKCSLTIAKFAGLQNLLLERGLAGRIHTAAITYDPGFDSAERILGYARSRGVALGDGNRMLRPVDGISGLREHFKLGVNFIESLVNRHRIEVYLLDADGAIAASYARIHWDQSEIVDRAATLLEEERPAAVTGLTPAPQKIRHGFALPFSATAASIAFAFFPKCPFCWAAYLSVFGIAELERIPYLPWLKPVFLALMLLNLFSIWLRSRITRRITGFLFAASGGFAILLATALPGLQQTVTWMGIISTIAGSSLSAAASPVRIRRNPQAVASTELPLLTR
jgi:protein SCO1